MSWDHIQKHSYDFGEGEIHFRSTWEINYAFYLEWEKKNSEILKWEYEPERYDFIGYNSQGKSFVVGPGYLPDFKVTYKDGAIRLKEIKGMGQGLLKLKRMKKYHPEIPVDLIDAKAYNTLKRQVGKMLNWY